MELIPLTDHTGRWFNPATSIRFSEDSWWNGNNHISCATGSQWDHQQLYYTRSGNWILEEWSQHQNIKTTYYAITVDEAIDWLIQNDHATDLEPLPADVQDRVQQGINAAEL